MTFLINRNSGWNFLTFEVLILSKKVITCTQNHIIFKPINSSFYAKFKKHLLNYTLANVEVFQQWPFKSPSYRK